MEVFILAIISSVISSSTIALEISDNIIKIYNADDFIKLSNDVNNGTSYAGSTVLLDADIDFFGYSDKFIPIGHDFILFEGKFDGQGHMISNLAMNSSNRFVGPFGNINGTSFRNVVVDSSCSIINSLTFVPKSITGYVGGIIGYIYPTEKNENVMVENCVNMASVTFAGRPQEGDTSSNYIMCAAGVIGYLKPNATDGRIRNCVNYGEINFSGSCNIASIGGILGAYLDVITINRNHKCIISNCVNYGVLVHSGTSPGLFGAGGITGVILDGKIENCAVFSVSRTNRETSALGKIVGGANEELSITNCFWTNENDINKTWGFCYPQNSEPPTVINSYLIGSTDEIMTNLNDWVENKGEDEEEEEGDEDKYLKWMMLHLNGGSICNTNEDTAITLRELSIADPTKEGHTFEYWCTDADCTAGEYTNSSDADKNVTDLYAMWDINSYIATFDFGNGTLIEMSFTFNETIMYPNVDDMKKFRGWNVSVERMPAYNLVIGESTTTNKKSSSKAGVIAGSVIGCVVLIVIVLAVIFIIFTNNNDDSGGMIPMKSLRGSKSKRRESTSRRAGRGGRGGDYGVRDRNTDSDSYDTYSDDEAGPVINSISIDSLYDTNYTAPSLMDALTSAGLESDKAAIVNSACTNNAKTLADNHKLFDGFTEADAAAIAMYTYDDSNQEKPEYDPYRLINKAIMGEGDSQKISGILYILVGALRKLPRSGNITLYRGVKDEVNRSVYKKGSVVMWPAPTSMSPKMHETKKFLSDGEDQKRGDNDENSEELKKTLFIVEEGWGYNIQPYSLTPEDEEILLEPERRFQVESVIESDGITIIKLTMLDTPLVLQQFFGSGEN